MRFGAHVLLASCAAGVIAACGGGSGGSTTESTMGTLRLSLTDAPTCGYDHVWITVEKVRVHRSSNAGPNDSGWSEVVLATPQRIDLLEYTNGRVLPLGETQLPAGTYTQMRLVLGSEPPPPPEWPEGTLANAIVPDGDAETALDTPSGLQSGLKMNVNLTVNPDTVADFVIDFDACKSFVKAGKSGKYLLKPVLSVHPMISSKIVGWVHSDIGSSANVNVSVQQFKDDVVEVVRTTHPDPDGKFVLAWVPTGNYNVVITAPGHVNAVMTGVPVTEAGATTIGSETVRFNPPTAAASYTVSGNVTGADSTVRALQTVGSDLNVEVASKATYVSTGGAYALTLPAAAPWSTSYPPGPTTITLAADGTSTYRIEAEASGATSSTLIDPFDSDKTVNFP
jgi:hypothetical protein